jgi:hypothetical protein
MSNMPGLREPRCGSGIFAQIETHAHLGLDEGDVLRRHVALSTLQSLMMPRPAIRRISGTAYRFPLLRRST